MATSFITRRFKWDGVEVRFPTTLTWSFQDISSSDSGRSLSGLMNKEIVATKRKLVCTWKMISDRDASVILSAIKSKTYGNLEYPDVFDGTDTTKRFYTGDASATMITVNTSTNQFGGVSKEEFVWDLSFDFIEQ